MPHPIIGNSIRRIDLEEVDAALRRDDERRESAAERRPAVPRLFGRAFTLPQLLRGVGALVLIAAALTFMLQHWEESSHLGRYFQFLGFTVTLAAAGLLCGTRLADDRGARTFLALAAAVVPAHFTFLGALLFSQFPAAGRVHYPDYARLVAPDMHWALLTIAVGAATLAPIVWTSMLALARPRAMQLTAAYLGSCAFLLLPTRDSDVIGLAVLCLTVGTALFDLRLLHSTTALRTREGTFARLMLLAPPVILLGRTLNLYEISHLFTSAMLATAAILLFEVVPHYLEDRGIGVWLQRLSTAPAGLAWLLAADTVLGPYSLGGGLTLPVAWLPVAGILLAMSSRCLEGGDGYRRAAALIASGALTANLVLHPGVAASFLCLLVAILTTAYGYGLQERVTFLAGAAALSFALLHHVRLAIQLYSIGPWASLAILGIATVFAATLIERKSEVLKAHLQWLRGKKPALEPPRRAEANGLRAPV